MKKLWDMEERVKGKTKPICLACEKKFMKGENNGEFKKYKRIINKTTREQRC